MQFKINHKEQTYFYIMLAISCCMYIYMFSAFYKFLMLESNKLDFLMNHKMLLMGPILYLLIMFIGQLLFIGSIRGNGIKVTPTQFPDIFTLLKSHSETLKFKHVPELYIIQGDGVLNAFATKFLKRNFVILHSDVLEAAYHDGIDAVSFIIGHELGHIKRAHVGFLKTTVLLPAKFIPFLGGAYSRACEYTCDNIGFTLAPLGGVKGMLVLAAGKSLYKKINVDEVVSEVKFRSTWSASVAECLSTHPQLVKRIAEMRKLEKYNLAINIDAFLSPTIEFKQNDAAQ